MCAVYLLAILKYIALYGQIFNVFAQMASECDRAMRPSINNDTQTFAYTFFEAFSSLYSRFIERYEVKLSAVLFAVINMFFLQ